MFTYQTTVKMHDTDAAGRIFFAKQFYMCHEAWEAFVTNKGLSFATILRKRNFFFPIVHAEADYKEPLFVSDQLNIQVAIGKLGRSSVTVNYELWKGKILVGTCQTIHVCVNNKTGKSILLPAEIHKKFGKR